MEGCLFTAGASRVCPDFHRIWLLSILSYLISPLVPDASCRFWSEWKAHRLSVNSVSGCAVWLVKNVLCGIVPCIYFAFCYLLNFAHFPAFYRGCSIQWSLCVELLQVSVESRQLSAMKSWIPWLMRKNMFSRNLHVDKKGWLVADRWVNLVTTRLWAVLRITESNYW